MRTAYLLDEMISGQVALRLRAAGVDAMAVVDEPGLRGASDEQVLELATAQGRTLITLNIKDFATLSSRWSADGRSHAGMLLISSTSFPPNRAFIGHVVDALAQRAREGTAPGPGGIDFL